MAPRPQGRSTWAWAVDTSGSPRKVRRPALLDRGATSAPPAGGATLQARRRAPVRPLAHHASAD